MSREIERHVLGAMLLENGTADYCLSVLRASDFNGVHSPIFAAISKLRASGKNSDLVSVAEFFPSNQILMDISGEVSSTDNVESHAALLMDTSQRAALSSILIRQTEKMKDESATVKELQDETESLIMAVREGRVSLRGPKPIRDVMREVVKLWGEIAEGKRKDGILIGLQAVDSITKGLRPGKLTVIAARPGFGKSALAVQIARQCGEPILLHSLEMLAEEQAERMVSQVTEADSYALRSEIGLNQYKESLKVAAIELAGLPVFISDDSSISAAGVFAEARTLKRKEDLKIVIVDYLQLLNTEKKYSRTIEVGEASKTLKRMALELKIHVIAIASLSRECEKREDKRPIKSDLRESGDIEHDADAILMLYQERDYNRALRDNEELSFITEFVWRKNRGGITGDRLAKFDGKKMRFTDLHNDVENRYREFLKPRDSKTGGTNANW